MAALLGLKERGEVFRAFALRQQSGSGRVVVIDEQANRLQLHEFPESKYIEVPPEAKGVILPKQSVVWAKAVWGEQSVAVEYLLTLSEFGLRMERYPARVRIEDCWIYRHGECNSMTGLWGIMVATEKMSPHMMVEFLARIPTNLGIS